MNCQDVRKKLSAFQDGEVSDSQKLAIQNHLQTCQKCALVFQEIENMWEALAQADTIEKAPYFWTRLSQRIEAQQNRDRIFDRLIAPLIYLPKPIISTVIFIFGLLIGVYLGKNIYRESTSTVPITLEQEMEQQLSVSSFTDLSSGSVGEIYASLISGNNELEGKTK